MKQISNVQMARKMMIFGFILLSLGLIFDVIAIVGSLIQLHRWPVAPTIWLIILVLVSYPAYRSFKKSGKK